MTPPDGLSGIARFWDAAAAGFDDEPDHGLRDPRTRAAWSARLTGWIPAGPWDVLDLGCGTGSLTVLLAEAGHRVTGVDVAPQMIDAARAKAAAAGATATLVVGDAAWPDDIEVDVVLARHLLWTLPDPPAALARWVSLVRPGGTLILVEGRWSTAETSPYTADAPHLPWDGGVTAADLVDAVRPLVSRLRVEQLGDDEALWGAPVTDERYALVAKV
ncbi:class I SAM-dependent methyltransferase [Cellulomonas sp. P5_E12]